MTITMKLLNPRLEYVPYPGGRIHTRWNGMSTSTPSVDLSVETLCRKPVTKEMQPLGERAVNVQDLCQNCYNVLSTYGFTQVALVGEKDEGEGMSA